MGGILINQERLSNLTELFPFTVFIIDKLGNFLEINDVDSGFLGHSRQELLKLNIVDFFPEHQKHLAFEMLDQLSKTGTFSGEIFLKIKNNNQPYSIDIIKVSDNIFFAYCKDVSNQFRQPQKLDTLFHSLFLNMSRPCFFCKIILDETSYPINYIILENNRSLENFTSLSSYKLTGKNLLQGKPFLSEIHHKILSIYRNLNNANSEELYLKEIDKWISLTIISQDCDYFGVMIEDITPHKKTLNDFNIFKTLIESSRLSIAITDFKSKIVYSNNFWSEMHGYKPEEIIGESYDILAGENNYLSKLISDINKCEPDSVQVIESIHKHKEGQELLLSLNASIIKDENGSPFFIISSTQEPAEQDDLNNKINDIDKTDYQYNEGDANFQAIFENAVFGIAILTLEGKFIKVNPAFEKILNIKQNDLKMLSIKDILPSEDYEKTLNHYKSLASGFYKSIQMDQNYISATGEIVNARVTRSLIRNKNGDPQYIICLGEDVTELRKTEAALRLSQFSVEHSIFATFWIGSDGKIYNVNKACCELLGYSKAELVDKSMYEIDPCYPVNGKNQFDSDKSWEKLKQNKIIQYETTFIKKDGTRLPVEVVSKYIEFEGKEYNFAYTVNISERKNSENKLSEKQLDHDILLKSKIYQLEQTLNKIETENSIYKETIKNKNKIINDLIIELPKLTNNAFEKIDSLLSKQLEVANERESRFVSIIKDNSALLKEVIDNNTDIIKVDTSLMELDINPFKPEVLVNNTISKFKHKLKAKHVRLNIEGPTIKKVINADISKCEQILFNLLSYTLDLTPINGEINLTVSIESDNRVIFSISNPGIEIKEEEINKIYDNNTSENSEFVKEYANHTALVLSCKLIELQEGCMGINEGKLWFSFDLSEELYDEEDNYVYNQLRLPDQKKILIAEDNELNLKLLVDILQIHNQEIIIARNGKEAVEKAKDTKPDLILMDIKMPYMCGIEATKILKSLPEFKKIPIIALTASAGAKAKERHIHSGFDDHLEKPYTLNALFKVLNKHLQ